MNPVKNSYPNGECPDCTLPIPDDVVEGGECESCGHAFYEQVIVKKRITIDITYDMNGTDEKYIDHLLRFAVEEMSGNGMFTGSTPAEVDNWNFDITTTKLNKCPLDS